MITLAPCIGIVAPLRLPMPSGWPTVTPPAPVMAMAVSVSVGPGVTGQIPVNVATR
jgi:hypothetical protein